MLTAVLIFIPAGVCVLGGIVETIGACLYRRDEIRLIRGYK